MYKDIASRMLDFIDNSPSCFHAVFNVRAALSGYERLYEDTQWELEPGGSYYVTRNDSSIIAFRIPLGAPRAFNMAAAHSDSPTFKLKPDAVMDGAGAYRRLNVEKYGGMIMSSWMDRPLSVAGRVVVSENGRLVSKLVNVDRDLLLIPNQAIHFNREVNDGYKYNPQIDMCPILSSKDSESSLMSIIAQSAQADESDILGWDLFLYNREIGTVWGADDEYVSSRALDDLQCVWALLQGLLQSDLPEEIIPVYAVMDNEEVGSLSRQGADSTFLLDTLERIYASLETTMPLGAMLAQSFMISADNAHAVHPNHPEIADPVSHPRMNSGIVLKFNANQKYTSDGISSAVFKKMCADSAIPVQVFANRSDLPGGSTLGNLSNRHVSVRAVDIGLPQLAMHSAYETAGVMDTAYLIEAARVYYSGWDTRVADS